MDASPPPTQDSMLDAARLRWQRALHYVRSQVTWNRVYRATSYIRSALWIVPFFAILLVLLVAPPLRWLDAVVGWHIFGAGRRRARRRSIRQSSR